MKKKVTTMTMFLTLTIMCCMFSNISVEAATKKSSTKKWAAAYMKIVKEANRKDKANKDDSWFYTPYSYDLIYFNNDKIPELVVSMNSYWVSMYSYDKTSGKVYTVMDGWGYGAGGNTGYHYLPKKNCLKNINNDHAGAEQNVYYGKMKNYEIVARYPKSLRILNYTDKNKNGYPDDSEEFDGKTHYYYGDKRITKKKFNSYGRSGKYKFLEGTKSFKKIKKVLKAKGA